MLIQFAMKITCIMVHFLICDGCGVVIESHLCSLPVTLKESVEKISFIPKKWNFEISGTCKKCI